MVLQLEVTVTVFLALYELFKKILSQFDIISLT